MKSFDSRGREPLFHLLVYAVLIFGLFAILFPFLYVLLTSFATKQEIITRGFFIIPHTFTFNAYGYLLQNGDFSRSFRNAIYITVIGTMVNMVFTSLMAYGLSKRWLRGRQVMNFLVLFTMLFSGGMIPTYLVVNQLNLINSFWALFLTGAIAPFHLIVMRSFFQNIPTELEESARIDGCSEVYLFWRIILPLSMPAIATFTLFYAVHNWNAYFNAILYLNDSDKWPLQVFLRQMLNQSDENSEAFSGEFEYSPAVRMAAIVLAAAPMLMVYPFLQKYFNKGMLLGSVKG